MDTITALFWADIIGIRRWLAERTISRLTVIVLFVLLLGSIAYAFYRTGSVFFSSLAAFEYYGFLTAGYIIHAAVILILWFAAGSAIAASSALLSDSNTQLVYLTALPTPRIWIAVWMYAKTAVANFFLLCFPLLPVLWSFGHAFDGVTLGFIFRSGLVLFLITLLASGIGTLASLLITPAIKGKEYAAGILGLAVFFIGMILLYRLVFPPQLALLYDADSTQFDLLFTSLPLNSPLLPTLWLARTVTHGITWGTGIMTFVAAGVTAASLLVGSRRFIPVLLALRSQQTGTRPSLRWAHILLRTKHPLAVKDFLSTIRLPSETGYGLFLFSIAVFMFVFLALGTRGHIRQDTWRIQLIVFSYGWLIFFAIAYALRFVFPLMAREGKTLWHILSMPQDRRNVLYPKLVFASLAATPIIAFACIIWHMLPFAAGLRTTLSLVSSLVIIAITLCQAAIGAVDPNFFQGEQPEKVSTSGMGLAALSVSCIYAVYAGSLVYRVASGVMAPPVAVALTAAAGILLIVPLTWSALSSVQTYEG